MRALAWLILVLLTFVVVGAVVDEPAGGLVVAARLVDRSP